MGTARGGTAAAADDPVRDPSAPGPPGPSFFSRVVRSFATLAVGESGARALGAIAQLILIRQLAPGPFGLITVGLALVGWFALVVDSGTEQLNVRDISREPDRFREFADPVLGLRIALSLVAAVAMGLGAYFFANSAGSQDVLPRFAVVLPAIAINLRWMVLGIHKARAVAIGNVAGRAVFLVAVVLFVTSPHRAGRVPWIEALAEAVYALVIIALIAPQTGIPRPRIDLPAWRSTMTEGFPLLVYGASRATILTLDVVLVGLILGHRDAGLYGAALKPVTLFLGMLGLFSVAFLAGFSASPERESTSLFRRSALLSLLAMVAVAVALSAASPLVSVVFGDDYADSAAPLAILAWTLPLAGLGGPYASVLIARGKQHVLMRNNVFAALVYLGANAAAIPLIGIEGAAAVRVGTYGLTLLLNHHSCVSRKLAPPLATALGRGTPRAASERGGA